MKGGKRYWFKLYNNFFDNEKIKQIKRKKDGDRLIVIFINCLAIAANCESGGYLKISENKFFTIETLAHHMGRNQKSIKNALDIFQEYSMIVQDEYGYKIKNWNKYQNLHKNRKKCGYRKRKRIKKRNRNRRRWDLCKAELWKNQKFYII